MLKKIKQEISEYKDHEKHMAQIPNVSVKIEENIEELVKISQRANATFKVKYDQKNLLIESKPYHFLIAFFIISLLFFPSLLLFQNIHSFIYWIVEIFIIISILLFFKFYPSTKIIYIDIEKQEIRILSNNLIAQYLVKPIHIPIKEFEGLIIKETSESGGGMTKYINTIYLKTVNKNYNIIDLPNGPIYFLNPHIFTENLKHIILKSIKK